MKRNNSGFTLIEILAVLRHPGEAKVTAAKMQITTFKQALKLYRMEQNVYPTQEQGLEALCIKPTLPPIPERYPEDGYLDSRKVPKDPWNHAYIYLAPGRNNEPYEIISYGADGEEGGTNETADISSSDL
jgi:general secretion pathway protein G